MNFNEAKNIFLTTYPNYGLEVKENKKDSIIFTIKGLEDKFIIASKEIIENYAVFKTERSIYVNQPTLCSICSKNYREQMVESTNEFSLFIGSYIFDNGNSESTEDGITVEISVASNDYLNYFRFSDDFISIMVERAKARLRHLSSKEVSVNDLYLLPPTIKVNNLKCQKVEAAISKSNQIIDNCLFTLPYIKNHALQLSSEWPLRHPKKRPFKFSLYHDSQRLHISSVNYNPILIKYYLRSFGNSDPVNKYLAFYNILEYYFIKISNNDLYKKLTHIINDPRFSNASRFLDKIIVQTLNHDHITDETRMLTLVLEEFTDCQELKQFLLEYEKYLGEKWFTKKKTIFGKQNQVSTNKDYLISTVASRIKIIRNALVHSTDRYERQERYIPSIESERLIEKELPLIRYLAEKVIIGSAEQ